MTSLKQWTFICVICKRERKWHNLEQSRTPPKDRVCKECSWNATQAKVPSSVKKRFTQVKSQARKRYLDFELNIYEFQKLADAPCTYCGNPNHNFGLDRLDSSKGYLLGNVVPCCKTCNIAKNVLSPQEYLDHCKKVVNFFKK
jgi:hypothetical protein